MDGVVSAECIARLWDRYLDVVERYQMVKRATDVAEFAVREAYDRCEVAYADEVMWAYAVECAFQKLQAATDAVFLSGIGISVAEQSPEGRVDHR